MKILFKYVLLSLFLVLKVSYGQRTDIQTDKQNLKEVKSYKIEVTHHKTSHLIFSSPIRYIDLGSHNLLAGKVEKAENVLRVKAVSEDFGEETNFSVITADGHFYSFDAGYKESPQVLNYDLQETTSISEREVQLQDLGTYSPALSLQYMESIVNSNTNSLRHLKSKGSGIKAALKSIYVHEDKFYFHLEIENSSNVSFPIDYVTFKVVDQKKLKRVVSQERLIKPIRQLKQMELIPGKSTDSNVYLFDSFTISKNKKMVIEIYEKNGGRSQQLKIKSKDLLKVKAL